MEITFKQQLKLHRLELQRFEHQSKENRRLWNIDLKTAEYLYDLILHHKPERILEIGSSNGFSTFWLSLAAESESVSVIVDSIEVDEKRFQLAKKNLQERKNVNLIKGLAEKLIPQLTSNYGFVFIDAGKIGYINYIRSLLTKIEPGAIIVADNVISHQATVRDYLDFMRNNDNFETYTVKIGTGLEISRYKANS